MAGKKKSKKKVSAKKAEPSSPLTQFRAMLDKSKIVKTADVVVPQSTASLKKSLPHIPTGSLMVDWRIGGYLNVNGVMPCPGIPRGKIVQIYGWNSCGKTTLALTTAATCIANGGTVAYLDYEHEVDQAYAKTLGVPIGREDKFMLLQPETLEHGIAFIEAMAKLGVDLIVVDSVGAGITKETYDLSQEQIMKGEKGRIGQVAACWSGALQRLKGVLARTGTAMIGISQLRFGGPGKSEPTVQGGEAWKFYTSIRMKLTRIGYEKEKEYDASKHKVADDVRVGQVVRMHLDKCKVSDNAHRECDFYIVYGKGIDDVHSIFDVALAHGVVKRSGAYYSWLEHESIQGKASALKILYDNEKEFHALYQATLPHLTGDITLSEGEEIVDKEPTKDVFSDELDNLLESGEMSMSEAKAALEEAGA